jgi:hypothetical protein
LCIVIDHYRQSCEKSIDDGHRDEADGIHLQEAIQFLPFEINGTKRKYKANYKKHRKCIGFVCDEEGSGKCSCT